MHGQEIINLKWGINILTYLVPIISMGYIEYVGPGDDPINHPVGLKIN